MTDQRMTKDQADTIIKLLIRINTTLDLLAHRLEHTLGDRPPDGLRIPERP